MSVPKCDICSSPMKIVKNDGGNGGMLLCTNCEQMWNFEADANVERKILKFLFPTKMNYRRRQEFYDYKLSEYAFIQQGLALFNLITNDEMEARIAKMKKLREQKKRNDIPNFWEKLKMKLP